MATPGVIYCDDFVTLFEVLYFLCITCAGSAYNICIIYGINLSKPGQLHMFIGKHLPGKERHRIKHVVRFIEQVLANML